jgi:hypothetical protein
MKTTIRFKLWDSKEKSYMMRTPHDELEFSNYEMADEYRTNYLQRGNYMNLPFNCLHIHKFINGIHSPERF